MTLEGTLIFLRNRHIKYFKRCLRILPYSTASYDTSRMTVLFFALSGLDLLNALDDINDQKSQLIDWIYDLQVLPSIGNESEGGFRGGSSLHSAYTTEENILNINSCMKELDGGHIVMTYTALASLIILGDDLSKINYTAIKSHISSLQCPDGSFYSSAGGSENDMRFIYSAATICHILQDFSPINIEAAVNYITSSTSFEGGLGQGPNQEAHGGSTFCGIAALHLMNRLDSLSTLQRENLVEWLIMKQDSQEGGLKGRPNKPPDTCYSFWIGATLKLLEAYEFVNQDSLLEFVLAAQDPITGGLGKYAEGNPDGLHSYLGISGLALMDKKLNELQLNSVHPALNISHRAFGHLSKLQETWVCNT